MVPCRAGCSGPGWMAALSLTFHLHSFKVLGVPSPNTMAERPELDGSASCVQQVPVATAGANLRDSKPPRALFPSSLAPLEPQPWPHLRPVPGTGARSLKGTD